MLGTLFIKKVANILIKSLFGAFDVCQIFRYSLVASNEGQALPRS